MEKFLEKLIHLIREFLAKQEEDRETPEPDFKGFATLGIIVGHTKRSPGASFALGGNEYDYNSMIARDAKAYADINFGKVLETHVIYRDSVGIEGAYDKAKKLGCDVVIELHFNAFNKKVSGTETLCTPDIGDAALAQAMQEMQCKVFNRKGMSRGVKQLARNARGAKNVYSFPTGYNCLVEPFFGDNPTEAKLADKKREEYAEGLIEQSISFFKDHLGLIN